MSIFNRSKAETMDVHASPAEKQLLADAAGATHNNISKFLLDASVAAANKALAVRRQFFCMVNNWMRFNKRLNVLQMQITPRRD